MRSRLIVVEGPDGVGKSTILKKLADYLRAKGETCSMFSFPGREAEGSLGPVVYDLHHHPGNYGIAQLPQASLQLLHVAAHIDAITNRIVPALKRGETVLLDRYWWSTWAYGYEGGVPVDALDHMIEVEKSYWGPIAPSPIIVIMRSSPLRMEDGDRDYESISDAYRLLMKREAAKYPVLCVCDDLSQEESIERLMTHIDGTPSVSGPNELATDPCGSSDGALGYRQKQHTWSSSTNALAPTEVYDTYWRFAASRQDVFFRRMNRESPPWTEDPILLKYRFTNVYRACDRVSQFLIRNVAYTGDQSPEELFFRIVLFKLFNKIETWRLLEDSVGPLSYREYRYEAYDQTLTEALGDGRRIYSSAYIMPSGGRGGESRKHRTHLRLLEAMMKDGVPRKVADSRSMKDVFWLLRSYPMMGDFLAYQYAVDLNYSVLTDFSEMEFVVPGPGARDGIRKCFSFAGRVNESEVIRSMAEHQEEEFARLGLDFRSLWGRPLQLIDCQNLFCEVDKYARIAHPGAKGLHNRTRIKRVFCPSDQPMDLWFPPKWGLNDMVMAEVGV